MFVGPKTFFAGVRSLRCPPLIQKEAYVYKFIFHSNYPRNLEFLHGRSAEKSDLFMIKPIANRKYTENDNMPST